MIPQSRGEGLRPDRADAREAFDGGPIRRVVRYMGLALLAVMCIGVPVSFALLWMISERAHMRHEAEAVAEQFEDYIARGAEDWQGDPAALESLLRSAHDAEYASDRALLVGGAVIAGSGGAAAGSPPPWPRVSVTVPVHYQMREIATIRAVNSMRPVAIWLGLVWTALVLMSVVAYHGMVVVPLALLERTMVQLRDAASRAQAAEQAKSEFLATMSHEIRTPLNGVLGMAELLDTTPLDDRQRMFTETIRKSGRVLLAVINDILDFSKIDAGHLKIQEHPFQLAAAMTDPARLVARAAATKGLELAIRLDPRLPESVVGDLGRIQQVVTNLLNNAVKFTDRGEVVLDLQAEAPAEDGAVRLRCEVRDSGSGIAADKLATIFDKFTQVDGSISRRHEGTGLGLAIAKGLVELMGGAIGAQSEPGRGSTFWFTLTLPVAGDGRAMLARPAAIAGLRVLAIDDSAASRRILHELLAAAGLEPVTAASAREGIGQLAAAARQGSPFDLVILDHGLPDMDSDAFRQALHAGPEAAAIPVLTLRTIDDLGPGAQPDGPLEGGLLKPAAAPDLIGAIAAALSAADAAPRAPGEAGAGLAQRAAGPAGRGGVDVLLAEDNEASAMVAGQVLLNLGLNHVRAGDGDDAVARFAETRPRLVLMDVAMPRRNGYEATERIRILEGAHSLPRTPIIGITAHALPGDRGKCLAAGMDDYLTKPIAAQALGDMIAKWRPDLGRPHPAGPGARQENIPAAAE